MSTNTRGVSEAIIAGALFDLMGFLTSREEVTTLSATHEAYPAVRALEAFAAKRGLFLDQADVKNWSAALSAHEPAAQGEAANLKVKFSSSFMDGWLEDESEEVLRHWRCVREAALSTAPPAQPAERVPEGWVLVPREALGYVSDLLAERKYGSAARSPAHNARIVVDYWLTASPAPSEGGKGVDRE